MRKVILGLAVSLDGYIEGPNGEYDWCFTDQDYGLSDFFKTIDTVFIGRKSFDVAGTSLLPDAAYVVFSRTLQQAGANMEIVGDNYIERVKAIKSVPGKDIWLFGGASLTDALLQAGLVDRLWLSIHPILLGAGTLLFRPQEKRIQLALTETKTYESGLVSLQYDILTPATPAGSGTSFLFNQ